MILFIIKKKILHIMEDYLCNIKKYLFDNFDLKSNIYSYNYSNEYNIQLENNNIIIFVQYVDENIIKKLINPVKKDISIYLLNTEQLTVERILKEKIYEINKYKIGLIDYSIENIKILKPLFPKKTIIHFPYPIIINNKTSQKDNLLISLISSKYRKNVCNKIKYPIQDFKGQWGKKRNESISKSKILLNIHYKPVIYNIFESIRCYNALEMKTLVISEPSIYMDKILLKNYIIFATKNEMDSKIKDVQENYELYYNQCFSDNSIKDIETIIKNVYKNSIYKLLYEIL